MIAERASLNEKYILRFMMRWRRDAGAILRNWEYTIPEGIRPYFAKLEDCFSTIYAPILFHPKTVRHIKHTANGKLFLRLIKEYSWPIAPGSIQKRANKIKEGSP